MTSATGRVELVALVYPVTRVATTSECLPLPLGGDETLVVANEQRSKNLRITSQNRSERPREEDHGGRSSKIGRKISRIFSRSKTRAGKLSERDSEQERELSALGGKLFQSTIGKPTLIDDGSTDSYLGEGSASSTSKTKTSGKKATNLRSPGDLIGRESNWVSNGGSGGCGGVADSISKQVNQSTGNQRKEIVDSHHADLIAFSNEQQTMQVAEFELDLIVENDDQMAAQLSNGKLIDKVNDLIESFVLDSQDVCLLNVASENSIICESFKQTDITSEKSSFRFDYIIKLIEHSLNYAYGLATTSSRCDGQSIELSASLVSSSGNIEGEIGNVLSIVDLLAQIGKSSANLFDTTSNVTCDCATLPEALSVLDKVKFQIQDVKKSNNMLVVGLKLKRKINGGLFSNKMSFIDFDPQFTELQRIFESIFGGQALAYLEKQKIYLQALVMSSPSLSKPETLQQSESTIGTINERKNLKHHHQVASMQSLSQAEWLLYKQLSSALISTLVTVHVFKLESNEDQELEHSPCQPFNSGTNIEQKERRLLIDFNLNLLEFVRSIKRASSQRMRRRKRHLRSVYHVASSNVSIASSPSNSVLSSKSSLDNQLDALAPWATPVRSLRRKTKSSHQQQQYNHRVYQEYNSSTSFSRRSSQHHRHHFSSRHHGRHNNRRHYNHKPRELSLSPSARSQYHQNYRSHSNSRRRGNQNVNNKSSANSTYADSMSLMRQVSATNRHLSSNKLLQSSTSHLYGDLAARHKRVANWRIQQFELAESSSVSTPSCGGRGSKSSHKRQASLSINSNSNNSGTMRVIDDANDVQANRLNAYLSQVAALTTAATTMTSGNGGGGSPTGDRLSSCDSDSIASANLNSQSSNSYNRLLQQRTKPRHSPRHSKGEEHIELKWMPSTSPIDQPFSTSTTATRVMTPKTAQQQQQVIQIDCPTQSHESTSSCANIMNEGHRMTTGVPLDNTVKLGDICSMVVAEPPKQLKLEEFLSQMTSVVGSTPRATSLVRSNRNSVTRHDGSMSLMVNRDDDDEDCKSHSSILDHLSTLAYESNSKFHSRLHHDLCHVDQNSFAKNDDNIMMMIPRPPDHIQKIPNGSDHQHTMNPNGSVEERLRALAIDCHPTQTSSPVSTPTSAFLSSNESNCSSTESSSNHSAAISSNNSSVDKSSDDSGHVRATNNRRPLPSKIPNLNNLYASVSRDHQNVRSFVQ